MRYRVKVKTKEGHEGTSPKYATIEEAEKEKKMWEDRNAQKVKIVKRWF